ncbi:MAG: hypothetical protein QOD30_1605 [Actinomycetota bacterium]|nr:hypothetical protein [Actinomycetota bacterium]
MSDARSADAEHLLALVARGVQRMADSFGALEQTLAAMPTARPVWVDELVERIALVERRVGAQGELVALLHEAVAAASAEPGAALAVPDERFAAIERVLASLRDELAIDRLETSLRDMAEDTSGLRADVRRSFDRVLHEISTTEESLKGEVRAIDQRLTVFGEDLRLVRGLRDGLEALAAGVDSVRQLAARSATSNQMGELATDLSTVLAEIESARAHVLSVDQSVGLAQASTIDVASGGDVARSVEELERTVTEEMSELGARIEQLAERAVVAASAEPAEDPIVRRLRSLATSARQLGLGITEDLKSRRAARPLQARARRT